MCDQIDNHEHDHDKYRQSVMEHVERHPDEFAPFMSFGESEEEEDKDFDAYVYRMKTDGEWAALGCAVSVMRTVPTKRVPTARSPCAVGDLAP